MGDASDTSDTSDDDRLGGRLPLRRPDELAPEQRALYDQMVEDFAPWAERSGFRARTDDGRLLGPFNAQLLSPELSGLFLRWMAGDARHSTLSRRAREVVILSVGAVWESAYELYAHVAVGQAVGLSPAQTSALAAGELPDPDGADALPSDEVYAYLIARSLAAEHRLEESLYREAEASEGARWILDAVMLTGGYLTTCAILNAFDVPAPAADGP